jgi:hypothetical protein
MHKKYNQKNSFSKNQSLKKNGFGVKLFSNALFLKYSFRSESSLKFWHPNGCISIQEIAPRRNIFNFFDRKITKSEIQRPNIFCILVLGSQVLSPFSSPSPFLQEKEQEALTYLATFYEGDI